MSEYMSIDAVIAIIEEKQKKLCPVGRYGRNYVYGTDRERYDEWQEIIDEIGASKTADVEEVVRCKDCEYAERYERTDGTAGYYCGHPQNSFTYGERWDRVFKPAKEADDFCSYGEPKEGDHA